MATDKWHKWYEMLNAAKRDSTQWYEIAAMMENHHVRCAIYNGEPYDPPELLEVAEEAVDAAESTLGKAHVRTAEAVQNLGFYYVVIDDDGDKAIDYFQKASRIAGERNPVLAATYHQLGVYFLYRSRDAEKSEEAFTEALAIRRQDPKVDPREFAETLFLLSYPKEVTAGVEPAAALVVEAANLLKAKEPKSDMLPDVRKRLAELGVR